MSVIAGFSVKKFAIVGFLEEDNVVEVIPSTWILNASAAKWPTLSSPGVLTKYIKQCKPIDKDWKTLQIKIYGFSNSFISARNKANLAQDTSNLESDSSLDSSRLVKQRKRKRPARYQTTDTSASENESSLKKNECIAPKLKQKRYSTLNDSSLKKQGRCQRVARFHSTDSSIFENEVNLKKGVQKLTEKNDSSFNDSLLLKQKRHERSSDYQNTDTSASENEFNRYDSAFNDSSILKKQTRKKPVRSESSVASASENESQFKQRNFTSPKTINDAFGKSKGELNIFTDTSHSKCNVYKDSLMEETEQKDTSSNPSKEIKEESLSQESNKMSQILQYVEQIRGELKDLNSKYETILHQLKRLSSSTNDLNSVNICLPIDIDLPVTSTNMLVKLNNKLKIDQQFSTDLVQYLHAYGNGKNERMFLLSLAKKILAPDVASCYTMCGRTEKESLHNFPEILNAVLTATNLKFKNTRNENLLTMFDEHLAEAKNWQAKR